MTDSTVGWEQWTVTAHVLEQYVGPNNGLVLVDQTETGSTTREQYYRTRQHSTTSNRPQLVVTWD